MTTAPDASGALDPCGCCERTGDRTPAPLDNPPGRTALTYRVGTHATFKDTMKARLATEPALATLRTRADDDPSIALLDAWASVLDVLTFYQERIAGEGFLATATEAGSVRELARTVGYQPAPGLAAGCLLAFTLEEAPTAPPLVVIEAGTKVQSLPGPGELPQTFETTEPLEARPQWNQLRPRASLPAAPGRGATELYLAGTAAGIAPGDMLLFVSAARDRGQLTAPWGLRTVAEARALPDRGVTRVAWDVPLSATEAPADPAEVRVHPLQRAAVFGHNAPDWRTMPETIQDAYVGKAAAGAAAGTSKAAAAGGTAGDKKLDRAVSPDVVAARPLEWPRFTVVPAGEPANTVDLDQVYPTVAAGSWVLLSAPGVTELYRVTAAEVTARADFTLTSKVTRLDLDRASVASRFGGRVRATAALLAGEPPALADIPLLDPVEGALVELELPVPRLAVGRRLLVSGKRPRLLVAEGQYTLTLRPAGGTSPVPLHPGEVLEVTGPGGAAGGDGMRDWPVVRAGGAAGTVRGTAEQLLPQPAGEDDPDVTEEAEAGEAGEAGGADPQATLVLRAPLLNAYDRGSLRVAANVAAATHGETREEVLGSGDAASALQSFTVRQGPLTYVRADLPGGAASTLQVLVGGVSWDEVPSLDGAGPRDRVYAARIGDDGRATVQFGDGASGARLPTGVENVTASYRVGTGLAGAVGAGRLTLLATRPLGVRGVTNPLPAGLAADPEGADATRKAAPRTALTLDRVVSLSDYQETARSFAGIAKALAAWRWDGQTRVVHLTVAGAAGQVVDAATSASLGRALLAAGDPFQRVRVDGYQQATFDLAARVVAAASHQAETVRAALVAVLLDAFSFERRELGQPVTQSEAVALMQAVPGVIGVIPLALHRHGEQPTLEAVLPASPAPAPGGDPRGDPTGPAALLTLDPDGLALTVTTEAAT